MLKKIILSLMTLLAVVKPLNYTEITLPYYKNLVLNLSKNNTQGFKIITTDSKNIAVKLYPEIPLNKIYYTIGFGIVPNETSLYNNVFDYNYFLEIPISDCRIYYMILGSDSILSLKVTATIGFYEPINGETSLRPVLCRVSGVYEKKEVLVYYVLFLVLFSLL